GAVSVARYGVPAKLLEVVELPLRSIGAAVYPELSRLHQQGDLEGMRTVFLRKAVRVTAAVLPFVILSALFAEPLIILMGGEQYRDTVPILYLFLAYCLLVPFDRFSGILLDSLNRPDYNMLKVWVMLAVNIAADITALTLFGTAESIAAASLVTYSAGTAMNVMMIRSVTGWKQFSRTGWSSSLRAMLRNAGGTIR
nr:oligosaccharide flippase family protein [Bacteroidota bacterium]